MKKQKKNWGTAAIAADGKVKRKGRKPRDASDAIRVRKKGKRYVSRAKAESIIK